ncbi:UNVERIFIED_CONTAM: translocation/assembly module TamB domain-containing protein, partial [Salmonella enterica subsp. enterica serovar Weltevreden]
KIEPGSSVTWSGDLLDAYVDIKAIYTIKTSPIDLIQNDLAGVDELERNKYRNMLTFLVYLKMNGFLSAPEISFDTQLAPKDKGAVNGTV